MASLIDLRAAYKPAHPGDILLRAYLGQLIGEPFLFARVSYGGELSLHFGTPRPMRSKVGNRFKGSYILGLRGSAWQLKSGSMGTLIDAGVVDPLLMGHFLRTISVEELERLPVIQTGAKVVSTDPFISRLTGGYGPLLTFSDGSVFFAVPTPHEDLVGDEEDAPEKIPYIADWELFTPHGLYLWVGPGWRWGYESSAPQEPPPPLSAQPPPPEPTAPVKPARRKPRQERE